MPTEPGTPLMAMLVWLGYINIMVAVFNMIPGFPMDGGRVLRAAIWWITGNRMRATRIATLMGQFIAFGLIVLGLIASSEAVDSAGCGSPSLAGSFSKQRAQVTHGWK